MKDTPLRIERRFRRLLAQRTGEERLKMGCSMHTMARALAKAYLLERHPGASPAKLKQLLFLHFYKADFGLQTAKRIAAGLSKKRDASGDQRKPARLKRPRPNRIQSSGAVREKVGTYGRRRKPKAKPSRSSSG